MSTLDTSAITPTPQYPVPTGHSVGRPEHTYNALTIFQAAEPSKPVPAANRSEIELGQVAREPLTIIERRDTVLPRDVKAQPDLRVVLDQTVLRTPARSPDARQTRQCPSDPGRQRTAGGEPESPGHIGSS